jgi:hypothetical protein
VDNKKRVNRETLAQVADFLGCPDRLDELIAGSSHSLSPTFTTAALNVWRRIEAQLDMVVTATREIMELLRYPI